MYEVAILLAALLGFIIGAGLYWDAKRVKYKPRRVFALGLLFGTIGLITWLLIRSRVKVKTIKAEKTKIEKKKLKKRKK